MQYCCVYYNMMGYYLFFTFLLLSSDFCYGQNASVSGIVQNEGGDGIPGAYVNLSTGKLIIKTCYRQ